MSARGFGPYIRAGAAVRLIAALVVTSLGLWACTTQRTAIPERRAAAPGSPRIEDLRVFEQELVKRHANLFFNMDEESFYESISELAERAPEQSDAEFELALRKILARIGDPNTAMSRRPQELFPFRFYEFSEGVATVATTQRYVEALGMRLVAVDEVPILDVREQLAAIIPHQNLSQLKGSYTDYLRSPRMLHLLGIADDPERAVLQFQDEQGVVFPVPVEAIPRGSSLELIHLTERLGLTRENAPLYRRGAGQSYWVEYDPARRLLFVQYNASVDDPAYPIGELRGDVTTALAEHDVAQVVIDLRQNGGGDASLLQPLIDAFAEDKAKRRAGYELYVFIGRNTSSSAVVNAIALKREAGATVVGEPTGGRPNYYGDVESFTLPNLGRTVTYSTRFFDSYEGRYEDADALRPDISAPPSLGALYRKDDPAMQAIR